MLPHEPRPILRLSLSSQPHDRVPTQRHRPSQEFEKHRLKVHRGQSLHIQLPNLGLRLAAGGKEAKEVGADGLHERTANYTQCDGEDGSALDSSGQFNLTFKTAMIPHGPPRIGSDLFQDCDDTSWATQDWI